VSRSLTHEKHHKAWIDGASRGNPGEAAIGGYIKSPSGKLLFDFSQPIGVTTNNVAEYRALEYLLTAVQNLSHQEPVAGLMVHSDSQLLVRQMEGSYRVRNQALKPLYEKVKGLIAHLPFPVRFVHIQRSENHNADRLANQAFALYE
jgi:ribonuclease HI